MRRSLLRLGVHFRPRSMLSGLVWLVIMSGGAIYWLETCEFPLRHSAKGYTHIVVAGAWMLADGSMSETFRQRVNRAVELHERHPRALLVFTGGLNDSVKAMDYARTARGGCVRAVNRCAWTFAWAHAFMDMYMDVCIVVVHVRKRIANDA